MVEVLNAPGGQSRDASIDGEDGESLTVIQAIMRCRQEADDAKLDRLAKNKANRDIYLGRQDWSYKQPGQSTELLPKVPIAVESMCSFIKRGLVQFGDWFSIDLDRTVGRVVDSSQLREVMKCFLNDMWDRNNKTHTFPIIMSDAVKQALMESLLILKVHGGMMPVRRPRFAPGSRAADTSDELMWEESEVWRLRIDVIRSEDYFPDPTGNGLYEIHRVERDLHEIIQGAEQGLYDVGAVNELIGTSYKQPLDERRTDSDRNQMETTDPSFRKKVLLDEFWGTILNADGTIAHRNVVATVANERFLIRKPEPNPFWHQESPFVAVPLIRVPFSVWHKALYDHASSLNIAINELFSLMIDGAIASVWGIKQLRLEDLEDPSQVSDGVPQGATLAVKNTLPHNADVLKVVATGEVPKEAMAMLDALNREFMQSVLSNELKVGSLPPKQVLATEIVEASQSQAITLDGIISDLEISMRDILRKVWLNILQNADDIPQHGWTSTLDRRTAMLILRASPEERYALFSDRCQFRVFGLSQTMQRALDFQKMMAMMQAVTANPILFRSFMKRYSGDKALMALMKALNLNPDNLFMEPDEVEGSSQTMQEVMAIGAVTGAGGGRASAQGPSNPDGSPAAGGSETPAQINQLQQPVTGLPANA